MRLKFLLLLTLMGSLAVLLGWSPGHTHFFGAPPGPGGKPDAHQNRADARPARPARSDDGPPPRAAKGLAKADPKGPKNQPTRRPDRQGEGKPRRAQPAAPTVPSPLAPLIAAKEKAARKGKKTAHGLPVNAPRWFREYDTDGDGQISLYEWKAHGHSIEDFKKADLNGDGFITMRELVRAGLFAPDKDGEPLWTLIQKIKNGEFLYLEVTGTAFGEIYGTDVYTMSSNIATAAVHAGVLRDGEKGFVKVTFLPGLQRYDGCERHGVTSHDYFSPWPRSYRIARP